MTGPELKQLREHLGEAIGRPLTPADMAKIVGLPAADGAATIRTWEVTGPRKSGRLAGRRFANRCATTCGGVLVKPGLPG